MKNDKINTKNCKEDGTKFLGNKSIRNKNKNYQSHIERKWKPYKFMTFEEKKRLADRESFKDHMKQV